MTVAARERQELYFLNVQERVGRCWDDFRRRGYLSSVGCTRVLDAIAQLQPGDRIAAYLRRCGYVGVGVVMARASRAGAKDGEYLLPVRWLRALDRGDAKWRPRRGLFASPQIMASLSRYPETVRFLQEAFGIPLAAEPPRRRAAVPQRRRAAGWRLIKSEVFRA